MLQLMFDFENDSEADAKIATSLAPAAIAASKPYECKKVRDLNVCLPIYGYLDYSTFKLGVRTGNLMPLKLCTACITSFASANYKTKKHYYLKSDGMHKDNNC